jgi:DNA-binding MarR family transcriptional regulator
MAWCGRSKAQSTAGPDAGPVTAEHWPKMTKQTISVVKALCLEDGRCFSVPELAEIIRLRRDRVTAILHRLCSSGWVEKKLNRDRAPGAPRFVYVLTKLGEVQAPKALRCKHAKLFTDAEEAAVLRGLETAVGMSGTARLEPQTARAMRTAMEKLRNRHVERQQRAGGRVRGREDTWPGP